MLLVVVALQVLILLVLLALLVRRPAASDPRLQGIPDAMVAMSARLEAIDGALRSNVSELRYEQQKAAHDARAAADKASRELREEINGSIATLGRTLHDGLAAFRIDNTGAADKLRDAVARDLNGIGERLGIFFADAGKGNLDAQAKLHRSLTDLAEKNSAGHDMVRRGLQERMDALAVDQREHQEKLRGVVEERLSRLDENNAAKLEQMRVTVDEKLHATLQTRLTESFGQVSDQLTKVHTGLGEMRELATGVNDLKKVFSNVKSRGVVGEFQLGMQLEQMFSREQYLVNAKIKEGSNEAVEFALKIPDDDKGYVLLPIDAKFPREDWERLEWAYEHGTPDEQVKLGKAFELAIRTEGKRICEKYIDPPKTLPFGIMFLPTEALYAEVMRRPGLHAELQSSCRVTVAGPSSFMAILTSFQMGFRTLAIQRKGNEVWNVLGNVKNEFGKFELLMNRVENNVKTVQNTLSDIGTRTRAINKKLHDVSELNPPPEAARSGVLSFDDAVEEPTAAGSGVAAGIAPGIAPLLAAMADEQEPRG